VKTRKILSAVFVLLTLGFALQLLSQPKPVDPVNWRELVPFLPDIEGWKARGEAKGSTVNTGNFKITQVQKKFTNNGNRLEIQITDGGYIQMAYAGFKAMFAFEFDTSDEYTRKTKIMDFPAIENFKYKSKLAMLMILVADRFLVQLEVRGLKDTSVLKAIALTLALDKLAALAK